MNDEFENALAWFCSAPRGWIESAKKDLAACAEWVWEVLQGDFNDNASTAQVVTGTVISMIPFVDQICDVRDVVANCKKINGEPDHTWHWVSLVLTLIGLIPSVGSLLKGCGKVLFAAIRKAGGKSGALPQVAKFMNVSIMQLNKFLVRPEIVATLKALRIDNPHKYLAKAIRKVARKLNTRELLSAFDIAREAAAGLLNLVSKWGSKGLARDAVSLLKMIDAVRSSADRMLAKALKPAREILERLERALDIEADMVHRANLNTVNPHGYVRMDKEAEVAAFKNEKPEWVDEVEKVKFPGRKDAPHEEGWRNAKPDDSKDPLYRSYETFHTMYPKLYPPGTKFYRVVDPRSIDNNICWMCEEEFNKLKSKADWRRRFAVWASWNGNGEFVTYTVPPGQGLKVWEGATASQKIDGTNYVLEGGATQIVIHPDDLQKSSIGPRQKTKWGYGDLGTSHSMIGVPVQSNNWATKTEK
ncbi:MAG: hypothetical protein ACXWVF_02095 [Telluria sp.]